MGADGDRADILRYGDPVEAAGEGLFRVVRMQQNPFTQHRSIRGQHLPSVRIMLPAAIGVAHGDVEPVAAVGSLMMVDANHIRLAGTRGVGNNQNRPKSGKKSHQARGGGANSALFK